METRNFPLHKLSQDTKKRKAQDWQAATQNSGGITFDKWHMKKWMAAVFGLLMAICVITMMGLAGVFSREPILPERIEGDANIVATEGQQETYRISLDYKSQMIQLSYLNSPSTRRRNKRDLADEFVKISVPKIVIEDFKHNKRYFIIPSTGNTTEKCWKSDLKGEMIPRDILKRLKAGKISRGLKDRYLRKYSFSNGVEVDMTTSNHGNVDKIVVQSKNISIKLRSGNDSSFEAVNVDKLKCFSYDETTGKIDRKFEESNQINYGLENIDAFVNLTYDIRKLLKDVEELKNTSQVNKTKSDAKWRGRRGLDWSYGAWCGPNTGGYENNCAKTGQCKAPYDKVNDVCKSCAPPFDQLDSDCMEHDRCLKEAGKGPKGCVPQGNRCSCDFALGWNAYKRVSSCLAEGKDLCTWSAEQIGFLFTRMLSCWFPTEICFPTITTVCRCSRCSCPILKSSFTCMKLKLCVPFGSGKIFW